MGRRSSHPTTAPRIGRARTPPPSGETAPGRPAPPTGRPAGARSGVHSRRRRRTEIRRRSALSPRRPARPERQSRRRRPSHRRRDGGRWRYRRSGSSPMVSGPSVHPISDSSTASTASVNRRTRSVGSRRPRSRCPHRRRTRSRRPQGRRERRRRRRRRETEPRLAGVDRDPRATFPLAAILRHVVRTTEALLVGERGGERFGIFFVIIRSPVCARRDFGAPVTRTRRSPALR